MYKEWSGSIHGGAMKKVESNSSKSKKQSIDSNDIREEQEVIQLLERTKQGDNEAWEKLCARYVPFVNSRVQFYLDKFMIKPVKKEEMRDDLVIAGWNGFILSLKNYDPQTAKLITYSRWYIDGEIKRELEFQFNTLGITEKPKNLQIYVDDTLDSENSAVSFSVMAESDENNNGVELSGEVAAEAGQESSHVDNLLLDAEIAEVLENAPDLGSYSSERRVLQILEILKKHSDEDHGLTLQEIAKLLKLYRVTKYNNGTKTEDVDRTLSKTMSQLLQEMDPLEYTPENEEDYRIIYDGYQDDLLKKKLAKEGKVDITNFSYVHLFSNEELDHLIEVISFTDILSNEDKLEFIKKLVSTASVHYRNPFWDGEKTKFNPKAIHSRFSYREAEGLAGREMIWKNLKVIQQAINAMAKISFTYNRHTAEHKLTPRSDMIHEISPYHLVVYHDNYYCIALNQDGSRVLHYRVDLMTNVQMLRNEDGSVVPVQVTAFEGLPLRSEYWSPDKYLAEHFNMSFDEPQPIRIKIKDIDYTILQEWFGNHFEKTREECENGYDIVVVNAAPSMIVHWALQYGSYVEIMNEDIRENIRQELSKLGKLYQN